MVERSNRRDSYRKGEARGSLQDRDRDINRSRDWDRPRERDRDRNREREDQVERRRSSRDFKEEDRARDERRVVAKDLNQHRKSE